MGTDDTDDTVRMTLFESVREMGERKYVGIAHEPLSGRCETLSDNSSGALGSCVSPLYRRVMDENTRVQVASLSVAVRGDWLDRSDVDGLFAFADADDVTELARQLERHDRRRLGYEYDQRRRGGETANSQNTTTEVHAND